MLTDAALRNLKPKSKIYKASDRDGMYVTVSPGGTVTFRYDYRLNGRRETLTLGRYGPGGISLAMARELLLDARKAVLKGTSPALEKQREKRRVVAIKTFGAAMETWLANARLADSTRAMRKHIIDRDILPVFQNRLLTEIQADDLRALCNKVKERSLQREASDDGLVRVERFAEPRLQRQRQVLIGRLQRLQRMGLATEQQPGVWAIHADTEPTLRAMGERGDIIRTMQRAMSGKSRELAVFEPRNDGRTLIGRVAGIYRRNVMLASGRYAMLDDGMGFSLVPWKPVIEQRVGQQLAATMRGGTASWELGRQRGPSIG